MLYVATARIAQNALLCRIAANGGENKAKVTDLCRTAHPVFPYSADGGQSRCANTLMEAVQAAIRIPSPSLVLFLHRPLGLPFPFPGRLSQFPKFIIEVCHMLNIGFS